MAYHDNFINDLNEIITLIKASKIEGENNALDKFKVYLNTVQSIGYFELTNWRKPWREKVWEFGEKFKKNNPQHFLQILDDKINSVSTANKEVFEFIRSEIAFNFLPNEECKKQIQNLIQKYPLNSEFRHTLGHYYYSNTEDLPKAISEYKLAVKIDIDNHTYLKNLFEAEYDYLTHLVRVGDYKVGQDYVKFIFKEKFYDNDIHYHNSFIDFQARFQDHVIFQNKLKGLEEEFKQKMHEELDSERKRIIEVVGFFSGIVAFILATVSIGEKFSFIEATCFLIGLGLILIMFAISLSILFNSSKKKLFEDKKFWLLVGAIIALFMYLFMIGSIADILKR